MLDHKSGISREHRPAAMDLILDTLDRHVLTPFVYPDSWRADDPLRQFISLYALCFVLFGGLYLVVPTLHFYLLFDHRLMQHPLFLKDQIKKEMTLVAKSAPLASIPIIGMFVLQLQGYSFLYDRLDSDDHGYLWWVISIALYLAATETMLYWVHRLSHHRAVYKHLHKVHHNFKIPTPYASLAFHPVDTFLLTAPYLICTFMFPMHKVTFLCFFMFSSFWTISIHDGSFWVPACLSNYINGTAHHVDHHTHLNYNYSQYFTVWDYICGTHRKPAADSEQAPIHYMIRKQQQDRKAD